MKIFRQEDFRANIEQAKTLGCVPSYALQTDISDCNNSFKNYFAQVIEMHFMLRCKSKLVIFMFIFNYVLHELTSVYV